MATPLTPFQILDSIFEVADTDNLAIYARNSSISCRELKSVQFCPNLVAMVTRLTSLKFYMAYLNSLAPKTLLFIR